MTNAALTFVTRDARREIGTDGGAKRIFHFESTIALRMSGMPGEISLVSMWMTRYIVSNARHERRVLLPRPAAQRLFNAARVFIQPQMTFSHRNLIERVTESQRILIHEDTPLPGEVVQSSEVTAGMPCALVKQDGSIIYTFIGMGDGRGFTYNRRSLGLAVFSIDAFRVAYGGHSVMRIDL